MKNFHLRSDPAISALFLSCLFFLSCGNKPEIIIDDTELRNSELKGTPIGLLEVRRANTGDSFGIPIGESQSESAFCTALYTGGDRIVTTSDCLQNKFGKFQAENMVFYVQAPDESGTKNYAVKEELSVNAAARIATLRIDGSISDAFPSAATAVQSSLSQSEGKQELFRPTITLSIPGPNRKGQTKIIVSRTMLNWFPSTAMEEDERLEEENEEMEIVAQAPKVNPIDQGKSSAERSVKTDGSKESQKPASSNPVAGNDPSEPVRYRFDSNGSQAGNLVGLRDQTWGSIVFLQKRMVGVVRTQDRNTNVQIQGKLLPIPILENESPKTEVVNEADGAASAASTSSASSAE